MDLMHTSQEWSAAHFAVNERLSELLNELRNLGYNPSYHVSYDHAEHHLVIDESLLAKHPLLRATFAEYLEACHRRNEAVKAIQAMPKRDLGFE